MTENLNKLQDKLFIVGAISLVIVFLAGIFGYIAFITERIVWARRSHAAYKKFQRRSLAKSILKRRKIVRAETERQRLGKASWSGLFLGGLVLTFAVVMLAASIKLFYDYERAKTWRTTDCVVQNFKTKHHSGKDNSAYPEISYSFNVDGKNYIGERYGLYVDFFNDEEMNLIEKRFQPKTHFPCFYNPANPHESIAVQRTPVVLPIAVLLAMIICFPLAGFLIYTSLPRRNKR